ncbi:MAG: aminoglycoside phosphotransferase family protein [Bacillota bacterium]|jgi:aminoglycoside phosphotransferase (APT) family kinase protein
MDLIVEWQAAVAAWLHEPVEIADIEEIRDWSSSRVLRITAKAGAANHTLYAKLAREGLARELAVYQLAAQVPGFPAPPASCCVIDGEPWLLLQQALGEQLYLTRNPAQYQAAAEALADFHEQSGRSGLAAQASGLPNVLAEIGRLVGTVWDQVRAQLTSGCFTGVEHELLADVEERLLWDWSAIHGVLECYPLTLLHGDSHSGNVFITGGQIQMVDWATAAIGPGLLDLVGLVDTSLRMNEPLGDVAALREAYWARLSDDSRRRYACLGESWQILRICRSLLELDWFARSGDGYGARTNRELRIISEALRTL